MNEKVIRWKQRFQNFEKAFSQFEKAVLQIDELSTLEKEGLIQRFEYTFELAWKTLKDFLESENVEARFPREVIKKGFQYEIISNGEVWMEMLENRNLMTHTYDEEIFESAVKLAVRSFYPEIKQLFLFFQTEIQK
ncbi:MAG: nucleotidyltransferase substrate binding protein [Mariniphaga sp.]|jgi:nucleotidyltransferase substrate binding protein (TIGR01987 family)|nr:nucleotidyltransferase substrate binding protein [Mariniphaga sp.]